MIVPITLQFVPNNETEWAGADDYFFPYFFQMMDKPPLQTVLVLHKMGVDYPIHPGYTLLETTEPVEFLAQSMAIDASAYISFQGGIGILIDGKIWNGGYEDPEEKDYYVEYGELRDVMYWPIACNDILRGKKSTSHGFYEQIRVQLDLEGNRQVKIWDHDKEESVTVDLLDLSQKILTVGRVFQQFAAEMLKSGQIQLLEAENPKEFVEKMELRIDEMKQWAVAKHFDQLEAGLKKRAVRDNGEIIWGELTEVLKEHPPQVVHLAGREGEEQAYFQLRWTALPEDMQARLQDFLAACTEGFRWRNPLLKSSRKYISVGPLTTADAGMRLDLRCSKPGPNSWRN